MPQNTADLPFDLKLEDIDSASHEASKQRGEAFNVAFLRCIETRVRQRQATRVGRNLDGHRDLSSGTGPNLASQHEEPPRGVGVLWSDCKEQVRRILFCSLARRTCSAEQITEGFLTDFAASQLMRAYSRMGDVLLHINVDPDETVAEAITRNEVSINALDIVVTVAHPKKYQATSDS